MTPATVTGPTGAFTFDVATGDRPVPVGLSSGHKRRIRPYVRSLSRGWAPISFNLEYSPAAELVRVFARWGPETGQRQWRRGQCGLATRKSLGRLTQRLAKCQFRGLRRPVLFLTLTYPEHYDRAPEAWKRHLDLFWRRLKYGYVIKRKGKPDEVHSFPKASCIWRLEFQERGAPHFHLILFDVGWLWFPWLDKAWNQIAGEGDEKHRRAGTECTWPRKWDDARAYVAKYIAKQAKPADAEGWIVYEDGQCAPNIPRPGRQWGVLGRAHLPESVDELEIPFELFEAIKAILVAARDDDRGEEWIRAPFRGLWGTCGPGPVRPLLEAAGLTSDQGG